MKLLVDIYSVEHAKQMIDLGLDVVVNLTELSSTKEFNASFEQLASIQGHAINKETDVLVMLDKLYHEKAVKNLPQALAQLNEVGIKTSIASDLAILNLVEDSGYTMDIISGNATLNTNYHTMNTPANHFNGFVISNEINIEEVLNILAHLNKTSILQGYGKQKIFYSKRLLLTSYYDFNKQEPIGFGINDRILISDEQTDNNSYIYEDEDGTYIYTAHDVCALRYHEDLMAQGLDYLYLNNLYHNEANYNEVVAIYQQLMKEQLSSGEVLSKLQAMNADLNESFLNDKTIFTVDEVKLLEREDEQ
jgi:collagenase-like PrtC family protease